MFHLLIPECLTFCDWTCLLLIRQDFAVICTAPYKADCHSPEIPLPFHRPQNQKKLRTSALNIRRSLLLTFTIFHFSHSHIITFGAVWPVGIAWISQVLLPTRSRLFAHVVQTGSRAHAASYPMGTWDSFLWSKAAGAECWSPLLTAEVKRACFYTFSPLPIHLHGILPNLLSTLKLQILSSVVEEASLSNRCIVDLHSRCGIL
jgi:hypothetical protein